MTLLRRLFATHSQHAPGELLKTLNMLTPQKGLTTVDGRSQHGFRVNNAYVPGGVLLFREFALMWAPTRVSEITSESLRLVSLINPLPELLLVGTGDKGGIFLMDIKHEYKKIGVTVEFMSTKHALGTFNVLQEEDRLVVAALLPELPDEEDPVPIKKSLA